MPRAKTEGYQNPLCGSERSSTQTRMRAFLLRSLDGQDARRLQFALSLLDLLASRERTDQDVRVGIPRRDVGMKSLGLEGTHEARVLSGSETGNLQIKLYP